jgi:hypothetical protein
MAQYATESQQKHEKKATEKPALNGAGEHADLPPHVVDYYQVCFCFVSLLVPFFLLFNILFYFTFCKLNCLY